MKLTLTALTALTTIIALFALTVNAQVVSCPLTIPVEKDSTTEIWGLQTAGQTPFLQVASFKPTQNTKEGFLYGEWLPLNTQLTTAQEINTVFLATQNRVNQQTGVIEMSAYYCVFILKGRNKKEKK